MKNIIYISFLFMLSGCGTDPGPEPIPVDPAPITFPELHLGETKNMLPLDKLTNGAGAVFVNQYGDEKPFFITVDHGIQKRTLLWEDHGHQKSVEYQAEYYKIAYVDSTLLNFGPYILLSMDYGPTGKYLEVLTAGIGGIGGSYYPIVSFDSTGRLRFGDEVGSYELNGYSYENVYTSMDHQPGPANYSRLYYNYELGIVAFEGLNGNMWALDRYEN